MNILITGDFYISDKFKNKDLIEQSVIDLFQQAHYRMVNLEAPLTADEPKNKILKTGPHLRMSEQTVIPYLKKLKVDAVTLANNHILDYGEKGLTNTFKSLKLNKIDYVGSGNNLNEATKPLTLDKDGFRIAILNFCENEWSIAEEDKSGANPMDVIDNTNQIKEAKLTHDKVICIIHGGHEYYHLPSPRMQKQYRFYAENGADAIVGHHTHCIGGYEIYKGVPILYSLGNFLFTIKNINQEWYKGLVVMLNITKNAPITFVIKHLISNSETFQVAVNQDTEQFSLIDKLSKIISKTEKLDHEWKCYGKIKSDSIIKRLSPLTLIKNKYFRYIFRKIVFENFYHDINFLKNIQNEIRCEAHCDLAKNVLKSKHETTKQ